MNKIQAIRYFLRLAELNSFSAVANELNTSQSNVSKKIAALETSVGIPLLHRSSRQLKLTPAGEQYQEHCRKMLSDLDELEDRLGEGHLSPKGRVKVSCPISLGQEILGQHLPEFANCYPNIDLAISLSDQFVDPIREDFDLVIRAGMPQDVNLKARHLFNNQAIYVASPGYLKHHGIPSNPESLSTHRCLGYSLSNLLSSWPFIYQGKTTQLAIRPALKSDNAEMLKQFAIADQGIALLPSWMVDKAIQDGKLCRLFTDYSAFELPVQALYQNSRYTPYRIRCFIDFLVKLFSSERFKQLPKP